MEDAIIDFAASRPDLNSDLEFGPVDAALISAAEAELGARLPNQYRDYISTYAGGSLLGWEFYGIPTERSNYPPELELSGSPILEIVKQNKLMQNEAGTLEFTSDGGGFFFAFIPAIDADAVFLRGYGADWSKLYESFHDMLAAIAEDSIRYPDN